MITTVNRVDNTTIFYKSWHQDKDILNTPLVDIVMRSFAAPGLFGQIIDYNKKEIYIDGGITSQRLPLMQTKTETEALSRYTFSTVCFHIIGTGIQTIDNIIKFNSDIKDNTFKQLWYAYLNPLSGGGARFASKSDQLGELDYISNRNDNISYKYYDDYIEYKYYKLDGYEQKYLDYYKLFGIQIAHEPIKEHI